MVLDGALPQESMNPGSNTPAAIPQGSLPVRLRPELVVKPDAFTLYFGFFGSKLWKENVADSIVDRVGQIYVVAGRAPTQDEMDVMTTLSSRAVYTRRLSLPIFYGIGSSWLFYKARQSPKFPKNPTPANLLAKLHEMRLTDKGAFNSMLARSCFQMLFLLSGVHILTSFAATWGETAGTLGDPRMKTFIDDIRGANQDDMRRRKLAIANEGYKRGKDGRRNIALQVIRDLGGYGYEESAQSEYDSASPAAALPDNDIVYNTDREDGQYPSTTSSPSMSGPRGQQQAYGQYGSTQIAGDQSSQSDLTSDFFGSNDDDASPTAPEYKNTNIAGVSTGSAWDRIRQQNSAQGSRSPSRQAPMQWGQAQAQSKPESSNDFPSGDGDRYDFDRRREKEQAQADFDKMMDAERNASSEGPPRTRTW